MQDRRAVLMLLAGLPGWGQARRAAAGPAELRVTLRSPDGPDDLRNAYILEAVRLALEKTRASHGGFRLHLSPPMNKRRALLAARADQVPNLLLTASPTSDVQGLAPVPFPIHLGVNGYRVGLVNEAVRPLMKRVERLEDLRGLRLVQGTGWPDVAVLRANGLQVQEVGSYEALFRMVALGRADMFCRGLLEIGDEWAAREGMAGLALDDQLLLSYDLPQYLYTNEGNGHLVSRLLQGLTQAHADGSLQILLRKRLQLSLARVGQGPRRLIALQAPPGATLVEAPALRLDLRRELGV